MSNPYAPPSAQVEHPFEGGIWRDGKKLVVAKGTPLPCRCVKCNAPVEKEGKTRKIYWHHPALYVLVLFWLILYLIVALIVRKQADINPSLCEVHRQKRNLGLWIGWGGSVVALVGTMFAAFDQSCVIAFVGLGLFLAAIIAGMIMSKIVYPEYIDDRIVRLRGCGSAFLDSFPPYRM